MLAYDILMSERTYPIVGKSFYKDHIISAILCKELNLKNWLEYGVFMGGSIFQINHMTSLLDHKMHFAGIDNMSDSDYTDNISMQDLENFIQEHVPNIELSFKTNFLDKKFDIVHIDAGHTYHEIIESFEDAKTVSTKDAIYVFDDYNSEFIDTIDAVNTVLDQGYKFLGGSISKAWVTSESRKNYITENFQNIFSKYCDEKFNISLSSSYYHDLYIKFSIESETDKQILKQVY